VIPAKNAGPGRRRIGPRLGNTNFTPKTEMAPAGHAGQVSYTGFSTIAVTFVDEHVLHVVLNREKVGVVAKAETVSRV